MSIIEDEIKINKKNIEIRLAIVGNVDSGKSSLISVLSNNVLDDGRGYARSLIMKHQHEKETGRTSSINHVYLKIDEKKYITLIDLAGHEKYLKTTMRGLVSGLIDYALILVGANMGVSRMTKEHLLLTLSLKIPIIIIITKIDISPENILNNTINDINSLIKKYKFNGLYEITENNLNITENKITDKIPYIKVSNKTGYNIELLRNHIIDLEPRFNWNNIDNNINNINNNNEIIFYVEDQYLIKGVGVVVSGKMNKGKIKKGDKLLIGPIFGKFEEITVRTIHDNFRTFTDSLESGESGCLCIRPNNKKLDMRRNRLKKGLIITNTVKSLTNRFEGDILILNDHSTTIRPNYQPVLNVKNVMQSARFIQIPGEAIRGGDRVRVILEFSFRSQYIEEGDIFIFREGKTKGIGRVIKLIN